MKIGHRLGLGMENVTDTVLAYRLVERSLLTLTFLGFVLSAAIYYWRSRSDVPVSAEFSGVKIATTVTIPISLVILIIGYTYVTLSRPVEVALRGPANNEEPSELASVRFYEGSNLSEIFSLVAFRDSGLDTSELSKAQLALQISISALEETDGEKYDQIMSILRDRETTLNDLLNEVNSVVAE